MRKLPEKLERKLRFRRLDHEDVQDLTAQLLEAVVARPDPKDLLEGNVSSWLDWSKEIGTVAEKLTLKRRSLGIGQ